MPAGLARGNKPNASPGLRPLVACLLLGSVFACASAPAAPSANPLAPASTAPAPAPAPANNAPPVYPVESRRAGEQGLVTLKVFVSRQGSPEQIELKQSSAYARLDQAAIEAVRKWQFIPAKRDDQAIATWVIVPIRFQFEESPPDKPGSAGTQPDLAQAAREMARLETEIDREKAEFGNPRRKFLGARIEEYRFAKYIDEWRQKLESIGTANYPEAARGKLYGSLVVTVTIGADGSLLKPPQIERSSGHKTLDDAIFRIIQLAAPFKPFPPEIRRDTDVIVITRTWYFTNDGPPLPSR